MNVKKIIRKYMFPGLAMGLGLLGLILRLVLLLTCRDDKGLLPTFHPLQILTVLLLVAGVAVLLMLARKRDGKLSYQKLFPPSVAGGIGYLVAAVGLAVTVVDFLTATPQVEGNRLITVMTIVTGVLGILCTLSCVLLGYFRWKGLRPYFLLHLIIAVFMLLRMLTKYRYWSAQADYQDFFFQMAASIFTVLAICKLALMDRQPTRRWIYLFMNQAAVFSCLMVLAEGYELPFYIGMLALMLTNLCSVRPLRPKPKAPAAQENSDGTA